MSRTGSLGPRRLDDSNADRAIVRLSAPAHRNATYAIAPPELAGSCSIIPTLLLSRVWTGWHLARLRLTAGAPAASILNRVREG